jgi:sigma-B regulation protein RsbU (phosphoserine phosphatase)
MIPLGSIAIRQSASILEARNKIRTVAETVLHDAVGATRVATATSEIARLLLREGNDSRIDVGLDIQARARWLVIDFIGHQSLSGVNELAGLFDEVDGPYDVSGENLVRGLVSLPGSGLPDEGSIATLRSVVEKKGRDELIAEIQIKNVELQDSLDNLRRERSAKERMESELNIGREIQMSMLPLSFPAFPDRTDFDVHASLYPAREVGGDFYDLFLIDNQHFCFCVGDVSGKGVPAALFMAVTKTLIKSRAANDLSPASILSHVNTELSHRNESCMFVTIFLAILDLEIGEMVYTNAGHNPPYVKRADGSLLRLDSRHGPIVGAAEGLAYREDREGLSPGDLVFLYTDGVTEAMNEESQLYTEDRLKGLLSNHPCSSVEESVRVSVDDVWDFQGEAEQADDITVMTVSYSGPSEDVESNRLELRAVNRLEEIARVNESFNQFAREHGIPDAIRRKINLVFDELLNNIISYAYGDDDEHLMEIVISLVNGRLVTTISDDGRAFNPFESEAPDTGLSVDERPIGGLGVHLVRSVMDTVKYERHGRRNVVTLEKIVEQ